MQLLDVVLSAIRSALERLRLLDDVEVVADEERIVVSLKTSYAVVKTEFDAANPAFSSTAADERRRQKLCAKLDPASRDGERRRKDAAVDVFLKTFENSIPELDGVGYDDDDDDDRGIRFFDDDDHAMRFFAAPLNGASVGVATSSDAAAPAEKAAWNDVSAESRIEEGTTETKPIAVKTEPVEESPSIPAPPSKRPVGRPRKHGSLPAVPPAPPSAQRPLHRPKIYLCSECDFAAQKRRLLIQHRKEFHGAVGVVDDAAAAAAAAGDEAAAAQDAAPRRRGRPRKKAKDRGGTAGAERAGPKPIDKTPRFLCSQCSYSTYLRGRFNDHVALHTGELPHKCPLCDYRCRRRNNLRTHHISKHTNEKRYKCDYCDYSAKLSAGLKMHMRRIHSGEREKNFCCHLCDYRTTENSTLKVHLITHGERPFQCERCPKQFITNSALTRHKLYHDGQHKRFSCPECETKFQAKFMLRQHMWVHTGLKNYSCYICGVGFSCREKFKKHFLKHPGKLPYFCSTCDFSTDDFRSFKNHESSIEHLEAATAASAAAAGEIRAVAATATSSSGLKGCGGGGGGGGGGSSGAEVDESYR